MNQGKIIVGIAVLLGIGAGLAGYWWNYRVGHRAIEYWGTESARLVRLAPKVEYYALEKIKPDQIGEIQRAGRIHVDVCGVDCVASNSIDLSHARGLIHLRNAILSDDQYLWGKQVPKENFNPRFMLIFSDEKFKVRFCFDIQNGQITKLDYPERSLPLGPLAKSLEQFLERELPRAQNDAAAKADLEKPVPAKSE